MKLQHTLILQRILSRYNLALTPIVCFMFYFIDSVRYVCPRLDFDWYPANPGVELGSYLCPITSVNGR